MEDDEGEEVQTVVPGTEKRKDGKGVEKLTAKKRNRVLCVLPRPPFVLSFLSLRSVDPNSRTQHCRIRSSSRHYQELHLCRLSLRYNPPTYPQHVGDAEEPAFGHASTEEAEVSLRLGGAGGEEQGGGGEGRKPRVVCVVYHHAAYLVHSTLLSRKRCTTKKGQGKKENSLRTSPHQLRDGLYRCARYLPSFSNAQLSLTPPIVSLITSDSIPQFSSPSSEQVSSSHCLPTPLPTAAPDAPAPSSSFFLLLNALRFPPDRQSCSPPARPTGPPILPGDGRHWDY